MIEKDSQSMINLITRGYPYPITHPPCRELVSDIKNLAVQVADALFKLGLLKIYGFSSNCISLVLLTGRIDTLFRRGFQSFLFLV